MPCGGVRKPLAEWPGSCAGRTLRIWSWWRADQGNFGTCGFVCLHLEGPRINGCILKMKAINIGSRCTIPFAPRSSIQCTVGNQWTWIYWSRWGWQWCSQVVVGHLNDAWTSGPLLMKESLIDGLVLPFSRWRPSTSRERMPVLALGLVKRSKVNQRWLEEISQLGSQLEKEGSVTRGTETPSVVVYVNNYTGSSGSMTVEGKGGYQEVHEEGALGKAHGKAQRRGRAAVGQTTAEGSMPAAGSSLRQSSNDGWSIISDAERN